MDLISTLIPSMTFSVNPYLVGLLLLHVRLYVCVCVREREREGECVFVYATVGYFKHHNIIRTQVS